MTQADHAVPAAGRSDNARRAGRGLVSIAGAKIWFIVTSYATHLVLPRLLGSPEEFGRFSTALSLASIVNNLLIAATVQTVSKLVSEDEGRADGTLRRLLGVHLLVGVVSAGGAMLAAPALAEWGLRDAGLTTHLQVVSAVFLFYSVYATLIGALNGREHFARQARLDVTFSTLRTAGLLGGAALFASAGLGALAALGGFATAAFCILLIALVLVGTGKRGGALDLSRWWRLVLPLAGFQLFLNLMLLSDVLVLKNTVAGLALDAGMSADAAASLANQQVGYYSAAQKFALVPYQLMLSMTFVVFPMISRATSRGDDAEARATLRGAMRFSLLVLFAVAAPIAGASDGVMRVAYPDAYLAGSDALALLVVGAALFALFVIAATAISGAGRPQVAMGVALVGLVAVVGGNRLLVQLVGLGDRIPGAAALGTASGMGLACLLGAWVVHRRFGAFLALSTVARCALASLAAFAAARLVPHASALTALASLAAGFVAFCLVLLVTRELRRPDFEVVFAMLRRRRASRG